MQSISVLFAPILVLLIAWAALLWAGEYARRLAKAGRRTGVIRGLGWAAVVVGGLGVLRGVVGVLRPQFALIRSPLLTPVALGLGTLLVIIGCWLLATLRTESAPRPFAAAGTGQFVRRRGGDGDGAVLADEHLRHRVRRARSPVDGGQAVGQGNRRRSGHHRPAQSCPPTSSWKSPLGSTDSADASPQTRPVRGGHVSV